VSDATTTAAAPRAAIHDLGYKRYLGTRRAQSSRWRVIVRNQVAVAWRGFWRFKVWALGATMTTVVFAILTYVLRSKPFEALSQQTTGSPLTGVDAMLPFAFRFYPWFGFVLGVSVAATVVSRDLGAGAFEFYFSRPVRPIDYVLGKFAGLFLLMACVLAAGPFLLALVRVGVAEPADMLATLVVVPKALLVGLLSAATYAALPLACGALAGKPRNTIAVWVAFYLVFGGIVAGIAHGTRTPALTALAPPEAVASFAFAVFDVKLTFGGAATAPAWASVAVMLGYTALGLGVTIWRVKQAERAGLGGG
jgi:ABC-2 type transport system permease protein